MVAYPYHVAAAYNDLCAQREYAVLEAYMTVFLVKDCPNYVYQ